MKPVRGFIFFIFLTLALSSCHSLEHINSFAKTSAEGLDNFTQIDFNFSYFCKNYREESLKKLVDTLPYANQKSVSSNCDLFKNTDSLVLVINSILEAYLEGLQKLSDKDLVNYKVTTLADKFSGLENQVIPSVTITNTQLSAVKNILKKLLDESVNVYREKKLKRIITDADSSFSVIVNGYIFIVQTALLDELQQSLENYKSFVYLKMYGWSTSPVERIYANTSYNNFLVTMDMQEKSIKKFIRVLEKIRDGHHQLALASDDLSAASLKAEIHKQTNTILEEIKDLKKLITHK